MDSTLVYAIAQAVNFLYTALIIYLFLGVAYTLNVFYIEIILFLSKKLHNIAKRVDRANTDRKKTIDNRKLTRLIIEYNRVLFEQMEMNDFFKVIAFHLLIRIPDLFLFLTQLSTSFKNYNGTNYVHYFLFNILLSFVAIQVDTR